MPIPDNPTIKIAFTGLLAFCFDGTQRCQVGVLRGIADHKLRFRVFKVTPDSREEFDFSEQADQMNVFLNVQKQNKKIELYKNGPFTRDETDDPMDFRWLVDFEGQEFHNEALGVVSNKLTPSFFLDDGLFYTALTVPADIIRNGQFRARNTLVASLIGANIYLDADDEAQLIFGEHDNHPLSMKKEDNVTYKIQVFDDCVECGITPGGDFHFYYDAFKRRALNNTLVEIPLEEKFSIQPPVDVIGNISPDSRTHPCGPLYGSQATAF